MSKHSLKGKTVLVGGGAKNPGGLISRTFAADGARICGHDNSASTKADADQTVGYHKSASAPGGLTKIEDIVPLIRFLVTDGWWITGHTIFANGGYTTR